MSVFTYKALGKDGREAAGSLSADNRAAAISQIMDRGLHPVVVEEKAGNGKAAARAEESGREGRVSQKSVESFTRELANLLSGGVPLARALQLLRREAPNLAANFVCCKLA